MTRLRLALWAVAYATLSPLVLAMISQTIKQRRRCYQGEYGASGRIRTSDRSVRSRVLYPAELRMHRESYFTAGLLSWHLRWFRKPDNNNVAVTKENMVHPGGLLGCASPYGPLLTQRYPPWCWR